MTEDFAAAWADMAARGIIHQQTHADLPQRLADLLGQEGRGPLSAYCGFDPTSDSLHLGSLLPALGLRRLAKAGLRPIALVGGATGMIGDPSGKAAERSLLGPEELARNVAGIGAQLERLMEGKAGRDFLLLDNSQWLGKLSLLDFLRDLGKCFSVNAMLSKDSVRTRLEDREQGISYTEFSYMLLQAADFLHLRREAEFSCVLQVGGSDQWGNITAGIDLIRRKLGDVPAFGATFPLLTTTDGKKFGKSEKGAIYLDAKRTNPYFMYKYLFDTADGDVVRFLNLLTLLPAGDVAALEAAVRERPQLREGQKALGRAVVALVHGEAVADACAGLETAMHQDDADAVERHGETLGLLDPAAVPADAESPIVHRPRAALAGEGISVAELAIELGLYASKADLKRELAGGNVGLHVAGKPVAEIGQRLTEDALGSRRVVQVRRGKRQKRMVCFR